MRFQDCTHSNVAYYYTKDSALNYFVLSLYKINLI